MSFADRLEVMNSARLPLRCRSRRMQTDLASLTFCLNGPSQDRHAIPVAASCSARTAVLQRGHFQTCQSLTIFGSFCK